MRVCLLPAVLRPQRHWRRGLRPPAAAPLRVASPAESDRGCNYTLSLSEGRRAAGSEQTRVMCPERAARENRMMVRFATAGDAGEFLSDINH